ncbi:MAG: hypothetical protein MUF54_17030 [Polyangiaceae bacterium]|jgi:hypothetical protein|nr:hypothetical protein [Polyangiaceae bacterium]
MTEKHGLEAFRFRLEAMGGAGFGDVSLTTGETVNTYGAAIGVGAGYVLPFKAYVGLRYEHFFGQTSVYPVPLVALIEHHNAASFMGTDLGYELSFYRALIRPQIGVGAGLLRRSVACQQVSGSFDDLARQVCAAASGSANDVAFAIAPGLLMGVCFSRLYGFTDVRYYLRENASALGVFGGIGVAL